MMNTNDVIRIFTGLGWTEGKDEVGDVYCELNLVDLTLNVMPKIKELTNDKVLIINYSLSAESLSQAVSIIRNNKTSYEPFAIGSTNIRASDFTQNDVIAEEKKIVAWAKSQSYENTLEEYRKKCPDLGLMQVYHLAALAIAGDVQKLSDYQLDFERGETQNFTPMIKKEMIMRAVNTAKKN